MGETKVLHRIFANAPEGDSFHKPGARFVPAGGYDVMNADLSDIRANVDELLEKTAPAGHETVYAVLRYSNDGETYGCVVTSYPDLMEDEYGRKTVLNHARLVRASEPSFDVAALYEAAVDFPYADVCAAEPRQRVSTYRDLLSMEMEKPVLVRPVTPAELQDLSRELLVEFLTACLLHLGGRNAARITLSDTDPAKLVRAWAALPLALQRRSSWAVEMSSCPVDVIFLRSQGKGVVHDATSDLLEAVQCYVSLLHEKPEEASSILNDPALRRAADFHNAVMAVATEAPEMLPSPGQEDMSNSKKPKPKAQDDDPLALVRPNDAPEWNRQHKALEDSLRRYIDERIDAFETRQRSQPAVPPSREPGQDAAPRRTLTNPVPGAIPPGWWQIAWPLLTVVLLVAALAVVYVLFLPGEPVQQPDGSATSTTGTAVPASGSQDTDVDPPATPEERAVTSAEQSNSWAEGLKSLLKSNPLVVVRAIDAVSGLAPREASERLNQFAGRIAHNEDLGPDGARGREGLRQLLLDCIASEAVPDGGVTIDGQLADVTPHLAHLKELYGVKSPLNDATAMELQSEIILRWIASRKQ